MFRKIVRIVRYPAFTMLMAVAGFVAADEVRINHDGVMQTSLPRGTIHGIGVSRIEHQAFTMTVRGQFRVLMSAKLSLQGSNLEQGVVEAAPAWISLTAIGEILLEIPGEGDEPPSIHHAKTAVYKVSEKRWILDSIEIPTSSDRRD